MPILGGDLFTARMDDFIRQIKAAKRRPGVSEILVPGEIDYRRKQEYRATGAKLDAVIFDQLVELADKLKVDFPVVREVVA